MEKIEEDIIWKIVPNPKPIFTRWTIKDDTGLFIMFNKKKNAIIYANKKLKNFYKKTGKITRLDIYSQNGKLQKTIFPKK